MTNILVIEDEHLVGQTLAKAIHYASRGEYEVELRCTAQTVHPLLRQWKYAAVVCDWRLPDACGLNVLAAIQKQHPTTRLILMTGYDTPDLETQAHSLGCAYIAKPFKIEQLLTKLSEPVAPAALPCSTVVAKSTVTPHCLLEALRLNLGAPYIMLLNTDGYVVEDSGDARVAPKIALSALLSNGMAVSTELTHALQESTAFDLHYHCGNAYEIYTTQVTPQICLSVIFCRQAPPMGQVWMFLKRTVMLLREHPATYQTWYPPPAGLFPNLDLDATLDMELFQ